MVPCNQQSKVSIQQLGAVVVVMVVAAGIGADRGLSSVAVAINHQRHKSAVRSLRDRLQLVLMVLTPDCAFVGAAELVLLVLLH